MADQGDVWRSLGRIAQRQHLSRVDQLLQEADRLSSIDGPALLEHFPLEFRRGDKDWDRAFFFAKQYLPSGALAQEIRLQRKGEAFLLSIFCGEDDVVEETLSVEQVVLSWQEALNNVASYPPPAP